jgi:hypothetical protein
VSVEVHAIGAPKAAAERGGDCRARDLNQGRNVHGGHRFAATTHCQISNGMLRVTVGASGVAPTLNVEAMTGYRSTGDVYTDVYTDVYPGDYTALEWRAMGVLTLDSSLLTALLTGVHLADITPESVTLRMVSPVMADAWVTLRRGETMLHIQHGSTRSPIVTTNRRIRWTDTGLTGSSATGIVTESAPLTDGFTRFVFGRDTVTSNAGAFSVTAASSSSADMVAGVASADEWMDVDHLRQQAGDTSRAAIFVKRAV